jgi:adenosylcobinamide-phosphate synthase
MSGTAVGLIAGVALDALLADPRRGHPVALFGRSAAVLERMTYRDSRMAGVAFSAGCVGAVVAAGWAVEGGGRARPRPRRRAVLVAAATWITVGGESLRREAAAIDAHLGREDLTAARTRLTHLVGRDPSGLDGGEIARAALESIAENTSDAIVAPLFWGAVAGVPGILGYRAVNTLDAMVGHRSARYRNFGWAAARLDDAANIVPARLTAVLVALTGGRPMRTWRAVRRDARRHPSPNAGWCEAAYAGALDVRLGGTNVYAGRVEERPFLGDGKPVQVADLARAAALSRRVTVAAAVIAALLSDRLGRARS